MSLKIQQKEQISKTVNYIQAVFSGEGTGHDWWHIFRVKQLALKIANKEGGNLFRIEMAALLHDLDDWKLSENSGTLKSKIWLNKLKLSENYTEQILTIIEQVSFKGAGVTTAASTIEAQIVQDADRLDAMGAIGIARTFAYGGSKNRLIYHPEISPVLHQSFEEYKKTTAPTINHFYEKLLLLKNRLNTATAKEMGEKRHAFMEMYLAQFFAEWDNEF